MARMVCTTVCKLALFRLSIFPIVSPLHPSTGVVESILTHTIACSLCLFSLLLLSASYSCRCTIYNVCTIDEKLVFVDGAYPLIIDQNSLAFQGGVGSTISPEKSLIDGVSLTARTNSHLALLR